MMALKSYPNLADVQTDVLLFRQCYFMICSLSFSLSLSLSLSVCVCVCVCVCGVCGTQEIRNDAVEVYSK